MGFISRHKFSVSCIIFTVVLLISLFAVVRVSCEKASSTVTVTVDHVPDYSHITDDALLGKFFTITTELEDLDTSAVGKTSAELLFLGTFVIKSDINIIPPSVPDIVSRNVCVTVGTDITADMFVISPTDIDCSFAEDSFSVDTPGEYEVTVNASRNGGEITDFKSKLTVIDPGADFTFDYGCPTGAIIKTINSKFREIDTLDASQVGDTGIFTVKCYNETTVFLFDVSLLSHSAGENKVLSYDIILGETVTEEDILCGIDPNSGITASFSDFPDLNSVGDHELSVTLTYPDGTVEEQTSHIRVHDINASVSAEMLTSNDELAELIFKDDFSAESLEFGNSFVTEFLKPGNNRIYLGGEHGTVTVQLFIHDTVPPELVLKDIVCAVGRFPDASELVESCSDSTAVTYSFKNNITCYKEGKVLAVVSATDAEGNATSREGYITFVKDTDAPKIMGAKDLIVLIGNKVHYSGGVYAEDDIEGILPVSVDSSAVNTQKNGEYELIYSAVDSSGNKSEVRITVTVTGELRVCLDVKNILQYPSLPNGCEVTSLAIVLNYMGYEVDPVLLSENYMPTEDFVYGNPWKNYVGNPKNEGLGCYAPVIEETGNSYLESVDSDLTAKDVSGMEVEDYLEYIDNGIPVILWGTMYMNCDPTVYWSKMRDGQEVTWHASSHCLVLIGYTEDSYIFCDPMVNGISEYSRKSVEESFEINFHQACVVE